jgi:hypothetical protein
MALSVSVANFKEYQHITAMKPLSFLVVLERLQFPLSALRMRMRIFAVFQLLHESIACLEKIWLI